MGKIVITSAGISGSAGSVAITGSFIVTGSEGAITVSGSGTELSGAHGSSTTTSGSTTFADAAGSSTSTSATGSVTSGSAGSATHGSGSSTYTDADGTHSTSATGSYTTGSGGSTSTTSGSTSHTSADGSTTSTSATGSYISGSGGGAGTGSGGSATHSSGSSIYTSADGSTHSTSATGSYTTGSGGSTSTTSGSTSYTDAGGSTTTVSATGSYTSGSGGSTTTSTGSTEYTDAGGSTTTISANETGISGSGGSTSTTSGSTTHTDAGGSSTSTSATGSSMTGSGGSATHGSGSSTYTDAGGSTTSTSATGSYMSGSTPGTTTTTPGGTTYEDTDSTTMHSTSGSHYSGSTPESGSAGSTTITDGTVEVTGSVTISGSSPALTIMAGELIVSGSSILGSTIDHTTTIGSHLTASYGLVAPTHGISGAYVTAYDGRFPGHVSSSLYKGSMVSASLLVTGGQVKAHRGTFGLMVTEFLTMSMGALVEDDDKVHFGTDQESHIRYDEAGQDFLTISGSDAGGLVLSGSSLVIDTDTVESGSRAGGGSYLAMTTTGKIVLSTPDGGGGGSARSVSGDDDDGVITWKTSDNTFTVEGNLTFDGNTLTVGGLGVVTGSQLMAYGITGSLATIQEITGGWADMHKFAGDKVEVGTHVSSSLLYGTTLSASTLVSGGLHMGHTGKFDILSASTVYAHAFSPSTISASTVVSGGWHKGFKFEGAKGEFATHVSSSLLFGTTLSASTIVSGGLHMGHTGKFDILSASTVHAHVFSPSTVSASTEITGGAVSAFGITGTLGTFSGVVSASSYEGFAVRTTHGEHAGTVSASVFIGSNVSASTEITGGWHRGHTGKFDILSASTIHAHVFSPSTISASLYLTGGHVYAYGITGSKATITNISATEVTASVLLAYSHTGDEFIAHNNVSASLFLTGGHVYAYGVTASLGTFSSVVSASSYEGFAVRTTHGEHAGTVSASVFIGSNVSASTEITGGWHRGHTGKFDILSASTVHAHVFSPSTVSASTEITGGAVSAYGITGTLGTFSGVVSASSYEGFAVRTTHGEHAGTVSASVFIGSNVSASTEITGGWHRGHTGKFDILSASTMYAHVWAPTTVSASTEITGGAVSAYGITGTLGTFFGLLSASSVHGFSHVGGEATYTGFVEAGTYMSAATHFTGGHVYAYGVTGTLGTFFGLLSASSVHGFSHVGGEAVYTGFVEAGTHMSASTHFTGGHVYGYGLTGSQATLTHAATSPPTYASSQLRLNYDDANFAFVGVDSIGSLSIESTAMSSRQKGVDALPANKAHGEIVFFGTEDSSDTLAIGKLMYLATGGIWKHADADAVASCGGVMLGIALGTGISDGLLVNGYANISGTLTASPVYKLTHGSALYVSTTPGEMTQTQPTASGDVSRVIGYAVSSSTGKTIYFNPSGDWVEQ